MLLPPNLKYVSLDDNNITSIAPIKEMTTLEAFDISNNPILDYRTVLDNASLVAAIEYCDFDIYKAIEANSIGSDTHAWTYVNVDGRWYHCDALWDQGCGDYPCYFNLGSETVLNTAHHVYKTELIPTAELEDMDVSEYIDYLDIVRGYIKRQMHTGCICLKL